MQPVMFSESNFTLTAPEGMEDCNDLPAWRGQYANGDPTIISVWELSDEEIIEIVKSKKVYVSIMGTNQPPISLMIESPFAQLDDNDGPGEEDGPWAEGWEERSEQGEGIKDATDD